MDDEAGRWAVVIESALSNTAIYQMFAQFKALAELPVAAKLQYLDTIKNIGLYSDAQIRAITNLILGEDGSGRGAEAIMREIDTIREEKVSREIDELCK